LWISSKKKKKISFRRAKTVVKAVGLSMFLPKIFVFQAFCFCFLNRDSIIFEDFFEKYDILWIQFDVICPNQIIRVLYNIRYKVKFNITYGNPNGDVHPITDSEKNLKILSVIGPNPNYSTAKTK